MNNSNLMSSSGTDWARVDTLTDDTIDTSDIAPLDADFFARAELQLPAKTPVTLSVDADVLQWFQAQGQDFQDKMNAALRIYAEAHQRAA